MRTITRHILCISALLLSAAGVASPSEAAGAAFTPGPCPPKAAKASVQLTCGAVLVPENRNVAGSRDISLAVVVAHTPATDKAPDPLMILPGGAGDAIIDSILPSLRGKAAAQYLGRRDLVVFDPRGVGYSTPTVNCAVRATGIPDASACLNKLGRKGVDVRGYTLEENVADVDAVRTALGLPAMNIWGLSYGTKWALEVERDFPADVRSLILDGADPNQNRQDAQFDRERAEAIRKLIAACDADAVCGAAFPDLLTGLEAAISRLNTTPLTVDGAPLTGDGLVHALLSLQTNRPLLPYLPLIMEEAILGTLTSLHFQTGGGGNEGSNAIPFLITCGEDVFAFDVPGLERMARNADPIGAGLARSDGLAQHTYCQPWHVPNVPIAQKQPVFSLKPVLIFNGQYDSGVPAPEARETAETLPNSRIVTLPGYAHVALGQGACPIVVATQFLDAQNRKPIDTSCVAGLPQPAWVTQPPTTAE